MGGDRAGGKGASGRLMSPAQETQSMRETPTKRGRVNRYVTIIIKVQQALSPHDRAYGFQIDMGRSSNYGRNSNILIPDPYH